MINSVSTNDAGIYSAIVTNVAGTVTSSNVALTVVCSPGSQTNYAGSSATFAVQTFGPESLNFQWQKNGVDLMDGDNISGSATSSLTIANLSDAEVAGYCAVVSDAASSVTTSNAALVVIDTPVIVSQPLSQPVLIGSNATFNVTAYGAQPLSFQWYFNSSPIGLLISDTNVSSYTITNAQLGDAGSYSVQVTNIYDAATSSNAVLSVYASAGADLSGISTTADNNIQFMVAGVPGFNYAVQASTNLVDWVSLITNTSSFVFTGTNSPDLPQQFYRAVYIPVP